MAKGGNTEYQCTAQRVAWHAFARNIFPFMMLRPMVAQGMVYKGPWMATYQ
jgi:hypothetical protein